MSRFFASAAISALLTLLLSACTIQEIQQNLPVIPAGWSSAPATSLSAQPAHDKTMLSEWWKQLHDEPLNWLIAQALEQNPDLQQAAARIAEARGEQKTSFAALFPQVNASVAGERSRDTFFAPVEGNSYRAGFDASYELDVFGKNRSAANAADFATQAAKHDYDWVKLSMIAEVARNYIGMRAAEKQIALAKKNLSTQKNTFSLVDRQRKAGATSSFDSNRAALQMNQSAARIVEYQRERDVYLVSLVTLTGLDAATLKQHIPPAHDISGIDLKPVADAPATVIAQRPDIIAANLRFTEATNLKQSQAAAIFPTVSLSGMFGLSKTLIVDTTNVWNIGGTAAVSLLDFGRVQGLIDAASAREAGAYETWRKAILQAMQDVETALTNVTHLEQQRVSLEQAKKNAAQAVALAQTRYRGGDSSLLDVLDAQRELIDADSALIDAEGNYVTAVVALYKALGQY